MKTFSNKYRPLTIDIGGERYNILGKVVIGLKEYVVLELASLKQENKIIIAQMSCDCTKLNIVNDGMMAGKIYHKLLEESTNLLIVDENGNQLEFLPLGTTSLDDKKYVIAWCFEKDNKAFDLKPNCVFELLVEEDELVYLYIKDKELHEKVMESFTK